MKMLPIILMAMLIMMPLISAQETTPSTDFFGWLYNSINGLWEQWFGGKVITTSINNPNNKVDLYFGYPIKTGNFKVESQSGIDSYYDVKIEPIIKSQDIKITYCINEDRLLEAQKQIEYKDYKIPTTIKVQETILDSKTDTNIPVTTSSILGKSISCIEIIKNPYLVDMIHLGENSTIIISAVDTFAGGNQYNNITVEANFSHLDINDQIDTNGINWSSLVAYYPFDVQENTNNKTYDYSNNSNDGTLIGGTAFNTSCLYGNCYTFDGVNDYVNASNSNSLIITTALTMSVWVKMYSSDATYDKIIFEGKAGTCTTTGYWLAVQNSKVAFGVCKADVQTYFDSVSSVPNGVWTHIVATYNGTTLNAWVNGVDTAKNLAFTGPINSIAGPLEIGTGLSADYINASIDEVMIFNTALNSSQISAIYNNQSQRFKTQGTQTIKQVNITTGFNQVNLTTSFNSFFNSNISGRIGFWDITKGYNNTDMNSTANGLVAYYHLDSNNGTANYTSDSSGTNNGNCINMGSDCNFTNGVYNNSISFDGSNDYINVTSAPCNGTPCSVSVWVKFYGGSTQRILQMNVKGTNFNGLGLYVGSNKVEVQQYNTTNTAVISKAILNNNTWYFLTAVWTNNSYREIYINGVYDNSNSGVNVAIYPTGITIGTAHFFSGLTQYLNGSIDEIMIFNRSLTADEVQELYVKGRALWNYTDYQNLTAGGNIWNISTSSTNLLPDFSMFAGNTISNPFYTPNLISLAGITLITNNQAPSVIFNTQIPNDITSLNVMNIPLNITYNISDLGFGDLNLSTINIFYKQNSTTRNCIIFINGTCAPEWEIKPYTSNISSVFTFLFKLDDNKIYPATYNLDDDVTDDEVHTRNQLLNSNNYIAIQLLNVTNSTAYNFFEIMSNGTSIQRLYYCNSSFTSTTNPASSTNCGQITSIPANSPYNHTHSINSAHQVVIFVINTTSGNSNAGIKITSTSWFILRGNLPTNSISYYTVINTSRLGAMRTTSNNGVAWTNETYTVDAHLHQFSGNSSLYYYVCANDTFNNQNCSSIRNDLFDLAGLPPTSPNVYSPNENHLINDTININYTASVSPNSYSIIYYNISLLNNDSTFNKTIIGNNSINLSYSWLSDLTGEFIISVKAYDNMSQSSIGYSNNFTISLMNSIISINFNPTSPQDYLTPVNTTCSSNGDGIIKLFREGIDVTATELNQFVILGGGINNYMCNITATPTFTNSSILATFTVNPINPSLLLTSSNGWTIPASTYDTIEGTGCPAVLTCNLYEAGTGVANPYTNLFPAGSYLFEYNTTGNANYSIGSVSNILNSQINGTGINGTIPPSALPIVTECLEDKFVYFNPKVPVINGGC